MQATGNQNSQPPSRITPPTGIDVEVEAPGRAAVPSAASRSRPRSGANAPLAAYSSQARRSSGVPPIRELEGRVVVQVRADAGQIDRDRDAERAQVVGRPDARAQQQGGGVVGAGAHDRAPGLAPSRARRRAARPRRAPCRRRSAAARPARRRRCAATAARARGRDRRARRSSARRRRCWPGNGATPVSASRSLRSWTRGTPGGDERGERGAVERRQLGLAPGCARACARSPRAAAARPRRATSRRGRSPRARRSRARCPRSPRSRCGSSSRRSCPRAGTRRAGRGSRRRSRSRAGATPQSQVASSTSCGQPPPACGPKSGPPSSTRIDSSERSASSPASAEPVVPPPMISVSTCRGSSVMRRSLRSRSPRSSCRLAKAGPRPIRRRSTRVIKAMAIAKHKTRRRELRDGRALARRVQRGDRQAFELLYASYEGRLYRFCHRLTGSDAAAASLVEATFVRGVATLPENGLDALDVPAHLSATARALAYERHTNGGSAVARPDSAASTPARSAPRISASPRASAWRSRCATSRGVPTTRSRSRSAPTPRRSPRSSRAPACGCARAPVARARGTAARDRLPALSAYADGTLPADRARSELETHVADCAGCRAALFALREAALRYRALPVPVPPGELRSRMTVALGAIGFPTRRPRALMPDPAPAAAGRPMAAAATMAALVIVGAGVTFVASRSDDGRGEPTRAPAPAPAPSRRRRCLRRRRDRERCAVLQRHDRRERRGDHRGARDDAAARASGRPPPARRPAAARLRVRPQRVRPGRRTASASSPPLQRRTGALAPPAAAAAPTVRAEPACGSGRTSRRSCEEIPVEILPPVAPPHPPATADAPPPPPEPPPPAAPAGPAQTTST